MVDIMTLSHNEVIKHLSYEELDHYINCSEDKIEAVQMHTRKHILWENSHQKEKTEFSIVYLHGFSASRKEVSPLCEMLGKQLKANVYFTRLSGHGENSNSMKEVSVNDWYQDTVDAVKIGEKIGEKVILIGTSTGGTLAVWYAAQAEKMQNNVYQVILISPNFGPKPIFSEMLHWPYAQYYAPLLVGKEWKTSPVSEEHEKYWYCRYPTLGLIPMMKLVKQVRNLDASKMKVPLLVLLSEKDSVVFSWRTRRFFMKLPADAQKKMIWVKDTQDPSHHVLVGNVFSPDNVQWFVDAVLDFVNQPVKP